MKKTALIRQFEKDFMAMRKELGFKVTLEELDSIFFLRDFISKENYVSGKLSRQVCSRIVDTYMAWVNYLHSLLVPNPGYLINVNESDAFSQKEKKNMAKLVSRIMTHASTNGLVGLTKERDKEAEFIDKSVSLWNKSVKTELVAIMKKVNKKWSEDSEIRALPHFDFDFEE
ncbi:MAG: hypothetical protein HY368_03120 [Candidatus Aenigmarchaeota archaeon]|nr:hypothetical protein [Candidatus Aenigmarchaeota archaeon]